MTENSVTIVNGWPSGCTGPSNPPTTSAPAPKRKHIPTPKIGKSKTSFDATQFWWGTITVIFGALMLATIAVDSDNALDITILFYVTLGFWTIQKKINELRNDD